MAYTQHMTRDTAPYNDSLIQGESARCACGEVDLSLTASLGTIIKHRHVKVYACSSQPSSCTPAFQHLDHKKYISPFTFEYLV